VAKGCAVTLRYNGRRIRTIDSSTSFAKIDPSQTGAWPRPYAVFRHFETDMALIRAEQLVKTYRSGDIEVPAVRGVDFTIEPKSFVVFVGPSGSGKSTLLNMIGCLDHPTSGKLTVLETDVRTLDRRAAAEFRGRHIGFVFQDFNLIPVLTAYENVEYPLIMVQDWPEKKRREQVMRLLDAVGMAAQANKRPDQISGGQKQRVAVARALATNAQLVLADEPTANLDHDTAYRVIELMKKMRDEFGTTFVFSTHDPKIMGAAEVSLTLEDGRIRRPAEKATQRPEAVHV
jgi:putative ABC transport system ATP-binding protein